MEAEIITNRENPLFSRKEVVLSVKSKITPTKVEAAKYLSEKFSVGEDLIRIKKIGSKFGSNVFLIEADIYANKNEFNRIVKKSKKEIEADKKA